MVQLMVWVASRPKPSTAVTATWVVPGVLVASGDPLISPLDEMFRPTGSAPAPVSGALQLIGLIPEFAARAICRLTVSPIAEVCAPGLVTTGAAGGVWSSRKFGSLAPLSRVVVV